LAFDTYHLHSQNDQWRIYFDMSPRFWLGLQMDYDLDVAEDEMGDRLSQEVVALANQS
jgi:plasmid maintenance system antidote protein VapI